MLISTYFEADELVFDQINFDKQNMEQNRDLQFISKANNFLLIKDQRYQINHSKLTSMSKSPLKDYTAILQQSRTKKKQDSSSYQRESRQYDRYACISRKLTPSVDADDTRVKLELALKHNTRLLDQNATLSEMANSLRFQLKNAHDDIQVIKRQNEDFLKNSAKEREALLMETQIKNANHELQLSKLLDQISALHEEKNNLEIEKTKQVQNIKADLQKSLLTQMQNLKNIQSNAKELYEVQIQNLKEQLKKHQYEVNNIKSLQRLQKNRLKDQLSSMQNQMKHLKQKYDIDLKELQRQYEKDKASQKRRLQQEKQLQANSFNLKIKRVKKELLDKAQDLENINKKMVHHEESAQLETLNFRKDKQNLLSELTNNEIIYKTTLMKEKTKLEELSKLQIENLTQLFETNIEQLQGEVNRLRLLIDCKTEQIKDSYEENRKLKDSFTKEVEWYQKQNLLLKQKLQTIELQHKEQDQAMKVKLAQLIETNTQQISSYFQKELANLTIHNKEISKLNKDLKDRIYKLIADNDEIRKTFEIESSKYKARIQDYKIKMASISLEHKEHIGSLTSKVEMTSQTLIREGDTKERTKSFYDQEKRKFYALANQKDQQIAELVASLQSIKEMHEQQLKNVRTQRDGFREYIEKLESDQRNMKEKLEQQLQNKDQKLKNLKLDNQKQLDQIKELDARLSESEKENVKFKKTIDHLNLVNQSLAQELGLKKGFIETLQLQSNAAIEQEKNKLRVLMGSHEVTLKEYFEEKLKSKNSDIESLERKVAEKEEDIRELIVKYNALEKRFDMAMEAQDKIREFEEKIRQLGLDNNLVKNMAELFDKKV